MVVVWSPGVVRRLEASLEATDQMVKEGLVGGIGALPPPRLVTRNQLISLGALHELVAELLPRRPELQIGTPAHGIFSTQAGVLVTHLA